jgi:hypothetical protein
MALSREFDQVRHNEGHAELPRVRLMPKMITGWLGDLFYLIFADFLQHVRHLVEGFIAYAKITKSDGWER